METQNSQKNRSEEVRTPLHRILDLAKDEIEQNIIATMENNQIPAGIMIYVLKNILLDLTEMKVMRNNNELLEIQELLKKGE